MIKTLHDVLIYGDLRAQDYIKVGKGIIYTITNDGPAFSKIGLAFNGASIAGVNGLEIIKSDVSTNGILFKHTSDTTKNTFFRAVDGDGYLLKKDGIENKLWHSGNDGHNSGLDADTLDGIHASGFSLINHNHNTLEQNITLGAGDGCSINQNNGPVKERLSIFDSTILTDLAYSFAVTTTSAPTVYNDLFNIKFNGDTTVSGTLESKTGKLKLKNSSIQYNETDGCIDFCFV